MTPSSSDLSSSLENVEPGNAGSDGIQALLPLTAALLECVTLDQVVDIVVERGVSVLNAEAGLVALVGTSASDLNEKYLEIVGSRGYPIEVMSAWQRFSLNDALPLSEAVRDMRAYYFTSRAKLQERYPIMFQRGPVHTIKSSVSLPLVARGEAFGGLHFAFHKEHEEFSDAERAFAGELARQCALALDRALSQARAEASEKRLAFLARATDLLNSSLEYETTLERLAHLCVPELADWVTVDILGSDGVLQRLSVAHVLPEMEPVMREAQKRFPPRAGEHPALLVLETGQTFHVPDLSEESIASSTSDPEQLALLRRIGLRSLLTVALAVQGRRLGAITFGMGTEAAGAGRIFSPESVTLAEELARRAAIAIENASLYAEARMAQEELIRRGQQYSAVTESADDVMSRFDADLRFLYVNRAIERHLGAAPENVIGKTLGELGELGFPEANVRMWSEAISSVFATGERRVIRFSNPSPILGLRWYEASITPEEGSAPGSGWETVIVVARDVTESRKADEAILRGVERLRLAAQAANIGTWDFRPDTGELVWDERCRELFGLPLDTPVDYSVFLGGLHEEDRARMDEEVQRAIDPTGNGEIDTEYRTISFKDGCLRWLVMRGRAFFREDGSVDRFIGVVVDITESKEREAEREAFALQQRRFLKEMLSGFTEGRLRLCDGPGDLPGPHALLAEPVGLTAPTLRLLRKRIEAVAEDIRLPRERIDDFLTAAHEAAMNAVRHANGGVALVHGDKEQGTIQVWVVDQGAGIAEDLIHRAVERGFTTGGFGQGFFFMQTCSDRLYLLTDPRGTTVILEMDRVPPEPLWLKSIGN